MKPSALQQLQRALSERRLQWLCSGCLAAALGFRQGAVSSLCLRLEGHPAFLRDYRDCAECGRFRLVTAFVGRSD